MKVLPILVSNYTQRWRIPEQTKDDWPGLKKKKNWCCAGCWDKTRGKGRFI